MSNRKSSSCEASRYSAQYSNPGNVQVSTLFNLDIVDSAERDRREHGLTTIGVSEAAKNHREVIDLPEVVSHVIHDRSRRKPFWMPSHDIETSECIDEMD
jgi:hypothetical protein